MIGMSRVSGQQLSGIDHIKQSITDILTTPIGSRVMVREYGSLFPELVDKPINEKIIQQIRAACVIALSKWEPRIKIQKVDMTANKHGIDLNLQIIRTDLPLEPPQNLSIPLIGSVA